MKKIFGILLIITLLISFIPIPAQAETLKQYKELLEKEKAKYAANQASINKTQSEINSTNQEIENIKKEMISMAAEIGQLQEDVTSYKEEIEKKELQTKKLIEYMQLAGGENLYLEYAFGAESITDLIYRMSVVEQLTDYNDNLLTNCFPSLDIIKVYDAVTTLEDITDPNLPLIWERKHIPEVGDIYLDDADGEKFIIIAIDDNNTIYPYITMNVCKNVYDSNTYSDSELKGYKFIGTDINIVNMFDDAFEALKDYKSWADLK